MIFLLLSWTLVESLSLKFLLCLGLLIFSTSSDSDSLEDSDFYLFIGLASSDELLYRSELVEEDDSISLATVFQCLPNSAGSLLTNSESN